MMFLKDVRILSVKDDTYLGERTEKIIDAYYITDDLQNELRAAVFFALIQNEEVSFVDCLTNTKYWGNVISINKQINERPIQSVSLPNTSFWKENIPLSTVKSYIELEIRCTQIETPAETKLI